MNENYRERLEEASEWLRSMYDLLSLKTDVKDIEFLQKRIDLFNWMIEQINRLYGGETFKGYKEMYEYSERIKNNALEQIDVTQRRNERLEQQNKRYLKALKFYADRNSYVEYVANQPIEPTVMIDGGNMAIEALESESE